MQQQIRLAEAIAAFSLTADLGDGVAMETTLRVWLLATRLVPVAGVTQQEIAATYRTRLLWSAACTATAHEETARFGDDSSSGLSEEHVHDLGCTDESRVDL